MYMEDKLIITLTTTLELSAVRIALLNCDKCVQLSLKGYTLTLTLNSIESTLLGPAWHVIDSDKLSVVSTFTSDPTKYMCHKLRRTMEVKYPA